MKKEPGARILGRRLQAHGHSLWSPIPSRGALYSGSEEFSTGSRSVYTWLKLGLSHVAIPNYWTLPDSDLPPLPGFIGKASLKGKIGISQGGITWETVFWCCFLLWR